MIFLCVPDYIYLYYIMVFIQNLICKVQLLIKPIFLMIDLKFKFDSKFTFDIIYLINQCIFSLILNPKIFMKIFVINNYNLITIIISNINILYIEYI